MVAVDAGASGETDKSTKYTVRQLAPWYAGYIVVGAIWPRFVYFSGFLRGWALALYAGWKLLGRFVYLQWGRPWARRKQAQMAAGRKQLTEELGREPTTMEVMAKLGYSTP